MPNKNSNLYEEYIKKFDMLKEGEAVLTPEAYTAMAENLLKEYNREYAKNDGAEGIDSDKQVELLGTRCDKELKELKLERRRINAELKLQSDKLDYETELQSKIAAAKAELLMNELVPADLPKRWWQRRARPNYAKKLMLRELSVEIDDYFTDREREIEKLEDKYLDEDIFGLLNAWLPAPKGKRARKKHEERIQQLALYIQDRLNKAAAAQPEPEASETSKQPERKQHGAEAKPKQECKAKAKPDTIAGQIAMDLPQGAP